MDPGDDADDWAAAAAMHETLAATQIASVRIDRHRSSMAECPQHWLWYY
jgi:hypothetical protein